MIEKGISPPPLTPPTKDRGLWMAWEKWFKLLSDATARIRTYQVQFNPASIPANLTAEQTVTVNGLGTTDIVYVNKPGYTAGIGVVNARVSAANTLAVTFMNTTASPVDPPSELYKVVAIRL